MTTITITCPHCGYAKDTPKARVPMHDVQVTCPRCKLGFPLNLGKTTIPESPPQPALSAKITPPASPTPEPVRNPSVTELSMDQGGEAAKKLLLLFVLLIVVLVGVRLWADSKKRNVPFPNFIATSAQEVAINWGQDIYFLDHVGKVLRTQNLPAEIIPTQLKYVGNELWIADYAGKTIKRLRDGKLETVVDGSGRFRGTFKFAADLQTGKIFVTDASNHKVHTFAADGRYLDSFGFEGKSLGALMFPNTVVFDAKGRLLIVNTNAQRLDIFERDGEYIEPFARVKPQDAYRYPTLLAQVGERVAFLLTVDLREAKAIMYGSDGQFAGELKPPNPLHEAGDIAEVAGRVLLTDNKGKRIYSFSADTLAYLGPFSGALDALGDKAHKQETLYANVANGALGLLVAAFLPVFVLYIRIRRSALKAVTATDHSVLVPAESLLTVELDRGKLLKGAMLLVLSLFVMSVMLAGGIASLPVRLMLLLACCPLACFGWLLLALQSGYADPSRSETLVRLVKACYGKIAVLLQPDEVVELCTAARLNPFNNRIALVLGTNKRLLIFDLSVRLRGIRQVGYGALAGLELGPAVTSSRLVGRLLNNHLFSMTLKPVAQADTITLQLSGTNKDWLERLRSYLERKRHGGERLELAVLCDTCYRPIKESGCPVCSATRKEDWKPLILSLIYPGLGQFYNREFIRGTFASALFSAGIIALTIPVIKMVNRSAEFTSVHVNFVVQNIAGLLFLYAVCCLDADQLGRKGRKLFSAATGDALRDWLHKRMATMQPVRRKLLIDLVPGAAHLLAGTYQRAALFLVPTGYLCWMACWSLLVIVSGHEVSADFYFFSYGSALAAMLWICMSIDGIRRLQRVDALRITGSGALSLFGAPFFTFVIAMFAQLIQEKVLYGNPVLRKSIKSSFRHLHALLFGQSGYAGFDAIMFLGWGGAVMALFAAIAWQLGKDRSGIINAALAGLCGGMIGWTLCASVLGGVLGSLIVIPVAFGLLVGLLVFLYFRSEGVSALVVPAIMVGAVIGNAVTIYGIGVIFSVNKLLTGTNASVIFSVALPACFMQLAYQVLKSSQPTMAEQSIVSKDV